MATPSASLATLRPDIAQSLMEFDLAMDRQGFIGLQVAPVVNVASQAGTFGKIPLEQLLANRETKRAPGSGYARGTFKFETSSYACEEHGAEEVVDDREAQMYAEYFDAEMVSGQRALDVVVRNYEKRIADMIFNATTWTGSGLTTGVTNEWDDHDNATPIADVDAAAKKVWDGCGMWPNALVVNRRVFKNLRLCAEVQDAIASSGAGESIVQGRITPGLLAQVFDVDFVIVAGSAKNTAKEGQSASLSPIWSDEYAMVCRIATTADFREPCIARTFHWSADGSAIGGAVESYREESVRGQVIRVRMDTDEMVLYAQCGHLLSNITT